MDAVVSLDGPRLDIRRRHSHRPFPESPSPSTGPVGMVTTGSEECATVKYQEMETQGFQVYSVASTGPYDHCHRVGSCKIPHNHSDLFVIGSVWGSLSRIVGDLDLGYRLVS